MARLSEKERNDRRKRLQQTQTAAAPTADTPPEPSPAAGGDDRAEPDRKLLTLQMNADGSVNLGKMQERTRARFLRALQLTPDLGADVPAAVAVAAGPELFSTKQIEELLKFLGGVQSAIAAQVWGLDPETAQLIADYSRDDLDVLAPPAARLASKRAPEWLRKYADELMFLSMFGTITARKIVALNAAVAKKHPAPPAARPTPAPAVQPAAAPAIAPAPLATRETVKPAEPAVAEVLTGAPTVM